jgi:putative ATP-binding cassette transporter
MTLSVNLCRQVLASPLRVVEEAGLHRVLTTLTTDVMALGSTMQAIPALLVNGAIIVGCVGYLAWLYPLGLLALMAAALGGAAVYWALHAGAVAGLVGARQSREQLMKAFRQLTEGIKELKMNRGRRQDFLAGELETNAEQLKRHGLSAMRRYLYLDGWSQALFYLTLGGMLLFFPRDTPNATEVLTGFAFAALYVMTPVWGIIGVLPTVTAGVASLRKIEEIGLTLSTRSEALTEDSVPGSEDVKSIELANVEFGYRSDGRDFTVGPLDLDLRPGEIVFIVGGNGSGKTTLMKLIVGLYSPDGGEIRLNGTAITDAERERYRQLFSAVFFDFQLFDRLLGASHSNTDALANAYLVELELDHKVTVNDRRLSTTNLSQGQRKRLALLSALIEERPVCVFDEWAADQDPHYKEIFYSRVLPGLKAQNKIVLVVTHDDRYFHYADRVINLEEGKIVGDTSRRRTKTA